MCVPQPQHLVASAVGRNASQWTGCAMCGPNSDSCQTFSIDPQSELINFQLILNQNWSIGKLCTVDPIVMFIQAPMFGYLYQNPLTIYLAFNFGNTFKIPFITCFLSKGHQHRMRKDTLPAQRLGRRSRLALHLSTDGEGEGCARMQPGHKTFGAIVSGFFISVQPGFSLDIKHLGIGKAAAVGQ